MRRIDVNGVMGPLVNQEVEIRSEQAFISSLDHFDIDQAIIIYSLARYSDPIAGNQRLLEWTRQESKLIPCFVLSPHYKYALGWAETEKLLQKENIRFAKIYPRQHGFNLHGTQIREIFDLASRLHIHLLIDHFEIEDSRGIELEGFQILLAEFPGVNVILTAVSHRRNLAVYSYLEHFPNFFVEFSLFNHWLVYEEAVKRFGSEHILWGSNMPFNMPGPAVAMLSYADIAMEDKENIAYKNILKLMKG
ncbi:amidohydrolase family protein [Paenibacillus eucommiae]|uniref:TIM-barrel fold metal-dependent hydrolase n=1 Tax=Paenibacillus eucommiae TaxID=1355755 RepID=A0ABS4IRE4_9BACL|nr:amidohydrolase family protein [Paenibacillus eucommiae]MBP1990142.1 putative TIM-barrel fold metal-dependent hydrolase [Paenibacillus eucommiae]